MVTLNLYGIPFHAVVVVSPEHDFLFKSDSTYCGRQLDCSLLKITLPGGFLGASRGHPEGIFGLIGCLLHGITKLYTFFFYFLLQLVLWNIIPGLPSYVPVETARN